MTPKPPTYADVQALIELEAQASDAAVAAYEAAHKTHEWIAYEAAQKILEEATVKAHIASLAFCGYTSEAQWRMAHVMR